MQRYDDQRHMAVVTNNLGEGVVTASLVRDAVKNVLADFFR